MAQDKRKKQEQQAASMPVQQGGQAQQAAQGAPAGGVDPRRMMLMQLLAQRGGAAQGMQGQMAQGIPAAGPQQLMAQRAQGAMATDPRMRLMQMISQRKAQQVGLGAPSTGMAQRPQPIPGTGMATGDPVRPGQRMPMDKDRIREARQTLMDYKSAKELIDMRIIANQQWWRQRNWEEIEAERGTIGTQPHKSASAWLKSSIINKHADYIESYPEPLFLARNPEDEAEARHLSEIVPVVLKQISFEDTYSGCGWQKFVEGLGMYAVTWDGQAQHGLGDISITKVNLLNIYTEPGVEDIQDSANVFCVRMEDNRRLIAQYPQLEGKLGHSSITPNEYREREDQRRGEKSAVVDWYYKKYVGGREVLHYCQFVGDEILFASENDPQMAQRGYYDHGLYPFVPDGLHPIAGSIYALSVVDMAKDAQSDIDTMSQAMVTNAVCNATPRYFVRQDGPVNQEQFLDWSIPLVEVNGNLGNDALQKVDVPQMDGNTLSFYQAKIEELRSVTGNTEAANGEVPSGITSGVALAAVYENAGKTSKDSNRASYRAMAKIYLMVVELIRQFYSMERQFRIVGEDGMVSYVSYSNAKLQMRTQADGYGGVTHRLPLFDVDVHVQRENAYTRMAVNDLATQFYQMGLFNPMMAPQALAMLQMMDFTGKEKTIKIIKENFMMTMMQMGGAAPQSLPQQGGQGAPTRSTPTEDDATQSGTRTNDAAHTPATDRMEQRINNATRP